MSRFDMSMQFGRVWNRPSRTYLQCYHLRRRLATDDIAAIFSWIVAVTSVARAVVLSAMCQARTSVELLSYYTAYVTAVVNKISV